MKRMNLIINICFFAFLVVGTFYVLGTEVRFQPFSIRFTDWKETLILWGIIFLIITYGKTTYNKGAQDAIEYISQQVEERQAQANAPAAEAETEEAETPITE